MTRQRMDDVLVALCDHGWPLLSEHEHPDGSSDPFRLEGDNVRWGVVRGDNPTIVELELHALATSVSALSGWVTFSIAPQPEPTAIVLLQAGEARVARERL